MTRWEVYQRGDGKFIVKSDDGHIDAVSDPWSESVKTWRKPAGAIRKAETLNRQEEAAEARAKLTKVWPPPSNKSALHPSSRGYFTPRPEAAPH